MSVPFEYPGSRVWVRAKVMQKEAFGILDTGADGTAIDSGFAAKIGLMTSGVEKGTVEADELELAKGGPTIFDLGPAKLEAGGVYVLPLASRVRDLDFILGFDVMGKKPFTLDYLSRTLELGPRKGREVPFTRKKDLRPSVPAEILGEKFSAIIDTGGSLVSLPLRWVEKNAPRLGVDLGAKSERTILGKGKLESHQFVLSRLTVAGVAFDNVKAEGVVSEKGSASDQKSNWASVGNLVFEKLGWLGFDGLRRMVALPGVQGKII